LRARFHQYKYKQTEPCIHSQKKGNHYFGMMAHHGIDSDSGLELAVRGISDRVDDVIEDKYDAAQCPVCYVQPQDDLGNG
jgi:hypothetical protein